MRNPNLQRKLRRIAEKYDTTIIFANKTYWDRFGLIGAKNSGCAMGSKEILLNEFDDEDKLILAFFHELAHIILKHATRRSPVNHEKVWKFEEEWHYTFDPATVRRETDAWGLADTLAIEHGYWFKKSTYMWAKDALNSYNYDPYRDDYTY